MKKFTNLFKRLNKFKILIYSFSILLIVQTLILANIQILDGDAITFYKETPIKVDLNLKQVYISGKVNNPGVYQLSENETLGDLINKASGLTDETNINEISQKYNLNLIPNNGDTFEIN